MVCGDFNEPLWQHEHLSRTERSEAQMIAFRDCLEMCELEDLGFSGIPFTYNNGQDSNRNVQVRLDRACADEAWRDTFPFAKVVHLATSCSDHCPLLIHLEGMPDQQCQPPFLRDEIMWERDNTLPNVIAEAWNKHKSPGGLGSVARSLGEVLKDLKEWSRTKFGNVLKDIERLCLQLADLQLAGADRAQVWDKMNQLDELLYREEMLWLQ
ncbi:uncharacterized protein [Aegilops tauschii subsp. strangulata]|uniref:uncharacterized protein n=1 Tax=Aegilops tauschii subsp. strangulata TaxID=200361 RepID=UPI003CC85FE4